MPDSSETDFPSPKLPPPGASVELQDMNGGKAVTKPNPTLFAVKPSGCTALELKFALQKQGGCTIS